MHLVPTPVRVSTYFAVVLIILVVVLGMFWNSKPKPKSLSASDTIIHETSFRLTLPGHWTSGPSDDPARRTYNTSTEQLTVSIFGSIFGSPGAMDHDKKVAQFTRMVEMRRGAETKMPGFADVSVSAPFLGELNGVLAARYQGFDPARQRRFHCMLLASSAAFEVFYYEGVDRSEQAAEDRAKAIFNSVDIPR